MLPFDFRGVKLVQHRNRIGASVLVPIILTVAQNRTLCPDLSGLQCHQLGGLRPDALGHPGSSSFHHGRWARLGFIRLAINGRLGQSENNKRFTGYRADIVVQAYDLDAGDVLDQRLHKRFCRFDQVGPDLLDQVSPFFRRRFGKLLFRGRQQTSKANDNEITDQIGVISLGPRPLYSCSKRLIPAQMAASISPCVFIMPAPLLDGRQDLQHLPEIARLD